MFIYQLEQFYIVISTWNLVSFVPKHSDLIDWYLYTWHNRFVAAIFHPSSWEFHGSMAEWSKALVLGTSP